MWLVDNCFVFVISFQIVTMTVFYMNTVSAGPQAPVRLNASATMAKSAVHWLSVQNLAAVTR